MADEQQTDVTENQEESQTVAGTGEETSQTEETSTEDTSAEETQETAPDVPETYEFTVSEGAEKPAQDIVDLYTPVLKELGLTQDQAQKLFDIRTQEAQKMEESVQRYFEDRDAQWLKTLEEDKTIGGDKLEETMQKVNPVLSKFDPDKELINFLAENRMQNCAPLVKFMARLAEQFQEDSLVNGRPAGAADDAPAHMKMGWKNVNEY